MQSEIDLNYFASRYAGLEVSESPDDSSEAGKESLPPEQPAAEPADEAVEQIEIGGTGFLRTYYLDGSCVVLTLTN